MTGYDRDFLAQCHIATRRPLIADRVRFYSWLGVSIFCGAFWVGVGTVVGALIGAAK